MDENMEVEGANFGNSRMVEIEVKKLMGVHENNDDEESFSSNDEDQDNNSDQEMEDMDPTSFEAPNKIKDNKQYARNFGYNTAPIQYPDYFRQQQKFNVVLPPQTQHISN